jgi:peroxiredoxin
VISLTGQSVPSTLADAQALDGSRAPHRLGDYWRSRPAVVVFVRHFGCIGCAAAIADLAPRLREIDRAGASTVVVGCGAPESIAAFAERNALDDKPVVLLTDPSLGAYRAVGRAPRRT